MPQPLSPGDLVVVGVETFLVWSTASTAIVALTLHEKSGPSRSCSADMGAVPFATVLGSSVVDITERRDLRPADCIRIGHLTPNQSSAVRLAIKRTEDNRRIEASVITSAIFTACKPSFRSGGRRVGGARAAA